MVTNWFESVCFVQHPKKTTCKRNLHNLIHGKVIVSLNLQKLQATNFPNYPNRFNFDQQIHNFSPTSSFSCLHEMGQMDGHRILPRGRRTRRGTPAGVTGSGTKGEETGIGIQPPLRGRPIVDHATNHTSCNNGLFFKKKEEFQEKCQQNHP